MRLYSLNGKEPQPLPESIRMPSGSTRTDSNTFTTEELTEAGYVLVNGEKPIPTIYEKVIWNGTNWEVIEMTDDEKQVVNNSKKKELINLRNGLLIRTDWIVLRAFEQNIPVDPAVIAYRQALRDLPETTTDYLNINWPTLPFGYELAQPNSNF